MDPSTSIRWSQNEQNSDDDQMGRYYEKFAGAEWNPIKSVEFMGKPFGSHKIKITPGTSGMVFRWSRIFWNLPFSSYSSATHD